VYYAVYQNIIAINHFKKCVYLCHSLTGKTTFLEQLLQSRNIAPINFKRRRRLFKLTDEEFKHNVALAKKALFPWRCIPIGLSRRFTKVSKEMSSMFTER
jgi:anthranilate synthase component 1